MTRCGGRWRTVRAPDMRRHTQHNHHSLHSLLRGCVVCDDACREHVTCRAQMHTARSIYRSSNPPTRPSVTTRCTRCYETLGRVGGLDERWMALAPLHCAHTNTCTVTPSPLVALVATRWCDGACVRVGAVQRGSGCPHPCTAMHRPAPSYRHHSLHSLLRDDTMGRGGAWRCTDSPSTRSVRLVADARYVCLVSWAV